MPNGKGVAVIILGNYMSKDGHNYVHIKAKRYEIRKNGFTNKKYITVTTFTIIYGVSLGISPSKISLRKEMSISEKNSLENAIENDRDPLFTMHEKELFKTEDTCEYIQYELKGKTKIIVKDGKEIDKKEVLKFFDSKTTEYVLHKSSNSVDPTFDIRKLNNYSHVLLLVSLIIKNRQECVMEIEETNLREIYYDLFKRGVLLFRKL